MKLRHSLCALVLASLAIAPAHSASQLMGGLHAKSYASGMAWHLLAFELGPWEEYLIHELTPNLERLNKEPIPRISWLYLDEHLIIPDFAVNLLSPDRVPLVFSMVQRSASLALVDQSSGYGGDGVSFEQAMIIPGLTHQVSERSALTVSAVLASQRFGISGMNLSESDDPFAERRGIAGHSHTRPEIVHGAGVRLALSGELLSNLTFEAAYQSRIEMAEFASLSGVHGSQAELDIPSRIQLGLQYHATARTSLNLGVSQIHYSEVGAFPSRSLPARFTALLGDSTSPKFEWDDLLVYSIGWEWRHDSDFRFYMDYRTRSQPMPSSDALARALSPELAQNAFMAGIVKGLGERSQLQLNAAYAPPEFAFGGNVLGIVTDKLDQSMELQATWRMIF